jgi:hypothetical protein
MEGKKGEWRWMKRVVEWRRSGTSGDLMKGVWRLACERRTRKGLWPNRSVFTRSIVDLLWPECLTALIQRAK